MRRNSSTSSPAVTTQASTRTMRLRIGRTVITRGGVAVSGSSSIRSGPGRRGRRAWGPTPASRTARGLALVRLLVAVGQRRGRRGGDAAARAHEAGAPSRVAVRRGPLVEPRRPRARAVDVVVERRPLRRVIGGGGRHSLGTQPSGSRFVAAARPALRELGARAAGLEVEVLVALVALVPWTSLSLPPRLLPGVAV